MHPSAALSAAAVAAAALGVVQAKLVAVLLGPAGMAQIAQLGGLLSLVVVLIVTGPGLYLVRLLAGSDCAQPPVRRVGEVVTLLVVSGFVLALAIVGFARSLAGGVLGDEDLAWAILLVGAAVLPSIVTVLVRVFLQGRQRMHSLALLDVAQAASGVLALAMMTLALGSVGALTMTPVAAAITCVAALVINRRHAGSTPRPRMQVPTVATLRLVGVFSAATLLSDAAYQVSFITVRSLLITSLGEEPAGLVHAASAMSFQIASILLISQSTYLYPRLSAKRERPLELLAQIERVVKLAVAVSAPIVVALISGAPILFEALLSPRFVGGIWLFQLFVGLECVRVVPWTLSMAVLPLDRSRLYATIGVGWGAVYLFVSWAMLPFAGVYAPVAGTVAAHTFVLVTLLSSYRRAYGFRLSRETIVVSLGAVASAALALALAAAPLALPVRIMVGAASVVLAVALTGATDHPLLAVLRNRLSLTRARK